MNVLKSNKHSSESGGVDGKEEFVRNEMCGSKTVRKKDILCLLHFKRFCRVPMPMEVSIIFSRYFSDIRRSMPIEC